MTSKIQLILVPMELASQVVLGLDWVPRNQISEEDGLINAQFFGVDPKL